MDERKEIIVSPEELAFGKQIVELYRAWDKFEEKELGDKVDGIDFDLVGEDFEKMTITSRREAIEKLEEISASITPSTPTLTFFKAKALSSSTYLRALEGETFLIEDYVSRTLGIQPALEPTTGLEEQKERTDEAFARLGYRPTADQFIQFFQENLLDKEEIVSDFNTAKERLTPKVAAALDLQDLLPLDYEESFVEIDEYWICWIMGQKGKMDFRINLHPKNKIRWFKGSPELLAAHEMMGHLLQALNFKDKIAKGVLNPGFGVTSIPGPEQWAFEGMADALPILIPTVYQSLSDHGRFAFEANHLKDLVSNNVHIMVNHGVNLEETKKYVRKYRPYETDERIEREVQDCSSHPLFRAYLLTYSDGGRFFVRTARDLGGKTKGLLRDLYNSPMTPDQIKQRANELKSA